MSCLSCIAVVDTTTPKIEVNKQGTKVTSADDNGIYVEEKDTHTAGYLKRKVGSLAYAWKKVRVVVEDKHILIYDRKKGKPSTTFPLHLCNVRPLSNKKFRVLCAPNQSAEFRVKDHDKMREWVTIIQEGIARQLSTQPERTKHNSGIEILGALRQANEANRFCADCNAPDPKWVSVNIGCIICIECSGVHRQLGVAISKVRSFELDMWSDKTEVTEKLGNADVNTIFEARLGSNNKPAANADREEREKYIYNKYVCKLYRRKSAIIQPIINTQQQHRKKSSCVLVMPQNLNTPTQKRIHIGSDVFSPELSKLSTTNKCYSPYRRPSGGVVGVGVGAGLGVGVGLGVGGVGFDVSRRGSYAGITAHSPASAKSKESILEQRRFSLFQAQ